MPSVTRSQARRSRGYGGNGSGPVSEAQSGDPSTERPESTSHLTGTSRAIQLLTEDEFEAELTELPNADRRLLLLKQKRLQRSKASLSDFNLLTGLTSESSNGPLARAAAATLVFAGEAAGTAVCISADGLLLTCAHCIAESKAEYKHCGTRWLLFASGRPVQADCIAWDAKRDLALLQITMASRVSSEPSAGDALPYVKLAQRAPQSQTRLYCIGHPGSEDLEADRPGVATGYDVLHASEGRFRGLAKGQDPEDNSEIGALMHDCWTYWGHSGAPLLVKATGDIVGLHSSWDDETGTRRGVALQAIRSFLVEHASGGGISSNA